MSSYRAFCLLCRHPWSILPRRCTTGSGMLFSLFLCRPLSFTCGMRSKASTRLPSRFLLPQILQLVFDLSTNASTAADDHHMHAICRSLAKILGDMIEAESRKPEWKETAHAFVRAFMHLLQVIQALATDSDHQSWPTMKYNTAGVVTSLRAANLSKHLLFYQVPPKTKKRS